MFIIYAIFTKFLTWLSLIVLDLLKNSIKLEIEMIMSPLIVLVFVFRENYS